MKLVKNLNKLLVCGVTLMSLASIGAVNHTNYVSASHVHTVRINHMSQFKLLKILPTLSNQQVKHIYTHDNINNFKSVLGKAIVKRFIAINKPRINKMLKHQNKHASKLGKAVAHYEFKDINNVRKQHGLKPLNYSKILQVVANARAKQSLKAENNPHMNKYLAEQNDGNDSNSDDLAHGMDSNNTCLDDAFKLGLGIKGETMGENESSNSVGKFYYPADNCGDPAYTDNDTSAKKIAYNHVRDMMKYDKNSNNGHRNNILDKHEHYLAVSTYYDPNVSIDDSSMDTVQEYM